MMDCCRWSGEIEGYALRQSLRYARQLAGAYDVDDLQQEAFLVFEKARTRYGEKVQSERHFMAIFKSCLHRRFWNMNRDMRLAARRGCGGINLGEYDRDIPDARKADVCLDDLPQVIQRMMARMGLTASYRGRKFIKVRRQSGETLEAYFRRIVGGDDADLAMALQHLKLSGA